MKEQQWPNNDSLTHFFSVYDTEPVNWDNFWEKCKFATKVF